MARDAARWVVGDDGSGVIKGRAKFCRPVFRSIAKIDKDLAVEYFEKHKDEFHPIARKLIEKVSWARSGVTVLTFVLRPAGHRHSLIRSSSNSKSSRRINMKCILSISVTQPGVLLDVSPSATDARITVWLGWYRKFGLRSPCNRV